MKTKTTQGTAFLLLLLLLIPFNSRSFTIDLTGCHLHLKTYLPDSKVQINVESLADTNRKFDPSKPVFGDIKGRVFDSKSGNPIPYAGVFVIKDEYGHASTWSDSEGNFQISGLLPGNYTVECMINSYLRSRLLRVEVDTQESTVLYMDMTFDTLAQWKSDYRTPADSGIVQGRVYCNEHFKAKKLGAATVTVKDSNGIPRDSALTDKDGHFSLTLTPGIYILEVQESRHKKCRRSYVSFRLKQICSGFR